MENNQKANLMDREEFIRIAGMGAGFALLTACLGSCVSVAPTPINPEPSLLTTIDLSASANASLKNAGGFVRVRSTNPTLIVVNTTGSAYIAVAQNCPHEGTEINYVSAQRRFICPNHGSRFEENGTVLNGPAVSSLRVFNAVLNANSLEIYTT